MSSITPPPSRYHKEPNWTVVFAIVALMIMYFVGSVVKSFGQCPTDINEDGATNVGDLTELLANIGEECEVDPEPLDIIPLWNNLYNHAPVPGLSFINLTQVRNDTVSWNDIKDDAVVYWIMTESQDTVFTGADMNFGDSAEAGMCEGGILPYPEHRVCRLQVQ